MGLSSKEQRKPFPLTDAEVIERSLLGVNDYYKRMKDARPFNVDECVNCVIQTFKLTYREARGYRRRYDALTEDDLKEMAGIYRRIENDLVEEARKRALSKASSIKARKVSQLSASAVIRLAFQENGFTPEITAQCYRAKVTVTLKDKYPVTMIIPYKAINNGRLDECIGHFKRVAEAIVASPYEFQVRKK